MPIIPLIITKDKLKNAQIISPYERMLSDGTRISTNARGEVSNRLLSYKINEVQRNGYTDRKDIKAYLNLVNVPRKNNGSYIPVLRMAITMQDLKTKSNYIIPFDVGGFLTLVGMRNKIKSASNVNNLRNKFIENHFDDVIVTQLYKDMLMDNCKFPVMIEEEEMNDNKVVLKNINVTRVDNQIPVLV